MTTPIFAAGEKDCTTSYGQPEVCGIQKEKVIVPAGLSDINPMHVGFAALSIAGGMIFIASRKSPSSL